MTKQNETRKRSVTLNQQHINEQARTVAIAFSSDKPYRRYFGDEVLQHEQQNVRMQRLENNAALLLDHDWTRQIGVVERAWLEEGKGRALVRFGKSSLAEEIFQDVIDGIRQHVSVGYTVHEYTEDENNAGLINVTDWEPLEISIVSVPADTDVGVGRNHDTKQPQLKPSKENTMKNEESTTKSIEQGTDNERKRVSEIMAMGKKYGFEEARIKGDNVSQKVIKNKTERPVKLRNRLAAIRTIIALKNVIAIGAGVFFQFGEWNTFGFKPLLHLVVFDLFLRSHRNNRNYPKNPGRGIWLEPNSLKVHRFGIQLFSPGGGFLHFHQSHQKRSGQRSGSRPTSVPRIIHRQYGL